LERQTNPFGEGFAFSEHGIGTSKIELAISRRDQLEPATATEPEVANLVS